MTTRKDKPTTPASGTSGAQIENEKFEAPYEAGSEVLTGGHLFTSQKAYPLDLLEFRLLSQRQGGLTWLAEAVFLIALSPLLGMATEWVWGLATNTLPSIDAPAVRFGVSTLVIAALLWLLSCLPLPGERKRLVAKLKKHFADNPRVETVVRQKVK